MSASDRKSPPLTGRSGTQRARRPGSRTTAGISAPWSSSSSSELRITSVFPCVARGFKAYASFKFTDCCWWRSLAVDGGSGTSRGHALGSATRQRRPRCDTTSDTRRDAHPAAGVPRRFTSSASRTPVSAVCKSSSVTGMALAAVSSRNAATRRKTSPSCGPPGMPGRPGSALSPTPARAAAARQAPGQAPASTSSR
jgi:hypothetical protein